jgi:hypothetical protein
VLDQLNRHSRPSEPRQPRRRRASARRYIRHGCRAAAARAFTAAKGYLDGTFSTLAQAADCCGSNVLYVQAALVLLQDKTAPDPQMVRELVLEGHMPLLAAARAARRRQEGAGVTVERMAAAYRCWTPAQRAAFGRVVGVSELWESAIMPAIGKEPGVRAAAAAML